MKRKLSQRIPFKIAILMIFLISLTSCEDFLNQKPTDGLVYDEYWKNKEEVLATLGGAYQTFSKLDYTLFVHGELRGDMLRYIPIDGKTAEIDLMTSNIGTNQSFANWGDFYTTINICNSVIALAPGVQAKDPTFTDYLLTQYVSEATFLRSLTYFYLVRIFQDVPYITVPTVTDQADFFPPLTSGEEILEAIKADLIAIRNTMPEHPTNQMTKSRATVGAVNALLADISLWNFEYDDCIKYIDAVEQSGLYFLVPGNEWFKNFSAGFTLENIFEIYFDDADEQPNSVSVKTYPTISVEKPFLYSSFYADEILGVSISDAGEKIRGNGSISDTRQVWKYVGADKTKLRSSTEINSANFIIYRLADLFLMKAEAYSQSETPDFAKALVYLNKIRVRADMLPYAQFSSTQAFEDAILLERAKELAYEGKRWFDLLRMGRRNDYARKNKLIETLVKSIPSSQQLVYQARLSDPNGWFMPIKQDEIEKNKNLTQNSYYDENK